MIEKHSANDDSIRLPSDAEDRLWSEALAWLIEFDDASKKDLAKLDKQTVRRIIAFLRDRVAVLDDPHSIGETLKDLRFGSFWGYRHRLPLDRWNVRIPRPPVIRHANDQVWIVSHASQQRKPPRCPAELAAETASTDGASFISAAKPLGPSRCIISK